MSGNEIDDYMATVPEPHRTTLSAVRATIRAILPNAQECITYGIPTFKVHGIGVAGFSACKQHCSYFPMSGSVFSVMGKDVAKYEVTKGALHFAVDTPLPAALIRKLIRTRLRQIAEKPLAKRR
ncbi:MAG: hypothetical protein H6Q05_3502 [Acidobacteria bacterium]|nr:hypothetical protein [Acidobacteriota bacterium]